ncbi:MAG: hypothetical protein ACREBF_00370 [Candidatus Micrarchaeales archaeon]
MPATSKARTPPYSVPPSEIKEMTTEQILGLTVEEGKKMQSDDYVTTWLYMAGVGDEMKKTPENKEFLSKLKRFGSGIKYEFEKRFPLPRVRR